MKQGQLIGWPPPPMSEHEGSSERWYDTRHEMEQFYSALWTVTASFRKAHRPTGFSIDRPLLWRFIEKNGGLHDRGTWLRIETGLPGSDYAVIKQRRSDSTDQIFVLTAIETHELIDDSLHNLAIAEMYTRSCGDLTMPPLFDFSCQHKKENEKMKESYYELA